MKTRIIKTKIWTDSKFLTLSPNAKLLLVFLLTSPNVGMSNFIECPDPIISMSTGIKTFDNIKAELSEKNLAHFHEGWVLIPNLEKHNNYRNSPSNENAYKNEISSIPKDIRQYYDSTVYSNHKSKIINQKSKIINQKSKIEKSLKKVSQDEKQKIAEKYKVPMAFVESKWDDILTYCKSTGKIYRDYPATLMAWVKKDALKITQQHHEQQNKPNKYGVTRVQTSK